MAKPTDQFIIKPIVEISPAGSNIDLSFTNSSLFMVVAVALATIFMLWGMRQRAMVPGMWQSLSEMLYEMAASMVRDTVGKGAKPYFPFVLTLFLFVLFCNLAGMIPGSFTVTSHIIVTFSLAMAVFLLTTFIGFMKHGLKYFGMFFPAGAPLWTAIILVPIEVISYMSRPLSLSVRLFANMTVGHMMLKVIANMLLLTGAAGIIVIVPGLVAVTALEFLIAFIQAYVFAILTCVYLHDALHMH